MNKSETIDGVAAELYATEAAVDAAIVQATSLIQSMIAARSTLSMSPVTFSAAQSKAMETIASLASARDVVIACHSEFQKDHRRMGWGTYAVGPLDKFPEDNKKKIALSEETATPTPLRRVA